jgi:putative tricarboxylic transport membrane protein
MHTPRRRLAGELVFIGLLVAFGAFMLRTAYGISGFSSLTSAGAFPMVAALVMLISAGIALAGTAKLPRAPAAAGEGLAAQFRGQLLPGVVVGFTLAIALYMLALERLGFLLASYVFLAISMRLLGSRRRGLNLLVSALSLGAIYVVFQTVFSVVLPSGTLLKGLLP